MRIMWGRGLGSAHDPSPFSLCSFPSPSLNTLTIYKRPGERERDYCNQVFQSPVTFFPGEHRFPYGFQFPKSQIIRLCDTQQGHFLNARERGRCVWSSWTSVAPGDVYIRERQNMLGSQEVVIRVACSKKTKKAQCRSSFAPGWNTCYLNELPMAEPEIKLSVIFH